MHAFETDTLQILFFAYSSMILEAKGHTGAAFNYSFCAALRSVQLRPFEKVCWVYESSCLSST